MIDSGTMNIVLTNEFKHPAVVECFDGARIMQYEYAPIASIAFGRVIADRARARRPHYHKKTTEWVYVVEGSGAIHHGLGTISIQVKSWIEIAPYERHSLRNFCRQDMVVVCISTPPFVMDDIHCD